MNKRKHNGSFYDLREKILRTKPNPKRRVVLRSTIRRKVTVHNEPEIVKPFMDGKRLTDDVDENDYHNSKRVVHECENNNLSLATAPRNAYPVQVFHQTQSFTSSYKSRGSTTEDFSHANYISCAETNLISTHNGALQNLKEKPQAYPPDNCSALSLSQLSIEDSVALRVKKYRLASTK